MFPDLDLPLADAINDFVDWLVRSYGDEFEAAANAVLFVLVRFEALLRDTPWWLILALIGALAFHATRRISATIGVVVAMLLIGVLGLWDLAMQTLALMLMATMVAILIGLPVGIAMALSGITRALMRPILDAMQTMPAFVYLIPAILLFGLGKVPALFATVIYAVPPLIRLTDLGIREVDKEVVEAATAFGATRRQTLGTVQLPLALPSIMAGINQTTMLALSMTVLASMIGARGLGQEVLLGIQRLDVGRGLVAGIGIVALAIVLDRITQGYGAKTDRRSAAS